MPPILKKATTTILLKEKTEGFDVYLLKRHEKSSFMAGNFVYPGGGVDREDSGPEVYGCCKGISPEEAHRILGGSAPPQEDLSCWVAGIRELFEEAGVLLAYDRKGDLLSSRNPVLREKFMHYRTLLQDGKGDYFTNGTEGALPLRRRPTSLLCSLDYTRGLPAALRHTLLPGTSSRWPGSQP